MIAALTWAALKPWLKSFNFWLVLAIVVMGGVIYFGNERLKERKAAAARSDAIATNATATVKAATSTVVEERKALEETPLTSERAALIEACKREASCRSRGNLK